MGRPRKEEKLIAFTVMLKPSDIEFIKEMAERAEMSAGKLARNLIRLGLDEARILDGVGLSSIIGTSRRTIEQIKKKLNITTESNETLE